MQILHGTRHKILSDLTTIKSAKLAQNGIRREFYPKQTYRQPTTSLMCWVTHTHTITTQSKDAIFA